MHLFCNLHKCTLLFFSCGRTYDYISQRFMSFVTHVFWYFGLNLPEPRNLGTHCRQIQRRTLSAASTLKMETVRSSEPYVNVYKIIWPHISECNNVHHHSLDPDSVVCREIRYGLEFRGSNPVRGKIFCPRPHLPRWPTKPPEKWAPDTFPAAKADQGLAYTTHSLSRA